MRATIRLELPDGTTRDLGHGDLIGRLWTAALHLDDGRISEAHAMVSLRGSELHLLALRGRFAVAGKPLTDVVLRPGLTVYLAPDLALTVREIALPDEVLALEGEGLPRRILTASCSLWTHPAPRLTSGFDGEAPAQLWTTGAGWRLRLGGQARPLEPGDTFEAEGKRFAAVAVTVDEAGSDATRARGAFQRPLRMVAHFDTVHVSRDGSAPLVLSGLSARILSELIAFDGPVGWEIVAREVWTDGAASSLLRRKWDVNLARLRAKLRDASIRDDLVRSDGTGNIELVRYPGDTFEDRT